ETDPTLTYGIPPVCRSIKNRKRGTTLRASGNLKAMKRRLLVPAAALLLSACGSVKIARINADPSHFRNQTVKVTGTVVTSVGLLNTGGYQLEDDTGKIFVVSRSGVPSRGSHVTVTGTVVSGAEVLGTPVATAIRERSHSVR